MRGSARSFAPIIIGRKKFPKTAGIAGIRKKNTMIIPCCEKTLLYVPVSSKSLCGVKSSKRIVAAYRPPRKKNTDTAIRYIIAMRLWSLVRSHDFRLKPFVK
jgi:hypothetical protein